MKTNQIILPMVDGGIIRISTDHEHYGGCETCDYGSCYINKFSIALVGGTICVKAERMYEYLFQKEDDADFYEESGWGNPAWSEGDLMRIILPNNDSIKEMTEEEFVGWLKEKLEQEVDLKSFGKSAYTYSFIKTKEEVK